MSTACAARSWIVVAVVAVGSSMASSGCHPGSGPGEGSVIVKDIPLTQQLDVLLVIDNARSTQDRQAVLDSNLPNLVQALASLPGSTLPSLHIGVVDTTVDIGVAGYGPSCPSPDPADNGLLQNTAQVEGCVAPTDRFISDTLNPDGSRTTNYGGSGSPADLGAELQCIGEVGTAGCGFIAPLEAMKRALDGSQPANTGFLRDGANLAVIILANKDDMSVADNSVFEGNLTSDFPLVVDSYTCDQPISPTSPGTYSNCKVSSSGGLQDPAYYASFLATIKDPSQTVVAVIAGPPPGLTTNDTPPEQCQTCGPADNEISTGPLEIPGTGQEQPLALLPSCTATINGNPNIARPAIRLGSFVDDFSPESGRFYTACQADYSAALGDIAKAINNSLSSCLEGPIDTTDIDPTDAGIQLDCTVVDVQNPGTNAETQTLIPGCKMDNEDTPDPDQAFPCWWTDLSSTKCPPPDPGYEINIDRDGQAPPAGTITEVTCAVAGA